jgi:hypothetical protein
MLLNFKMRADIASSSFALIILYLLNLSFGIKLRVEICNYCVLIYITGTLSDLHEKQRTSARISLPVCFHNRNSNRNIEVKKY